MVLDKVLKYIRGWWGSPDTTVLPPLPSQDEREMITVSLASTSARLGDVHRTIESILSQTLPADRLVLWLSEEPHLVDCGVTPADVGQPLRKLTEEGLEIRWTHNTGPYRKLVPVLREVKASGGVLVTADDDVLYPEGWLEKIYRIHLQHPEAIICYRGFHMKSFSEGHLTPYLKWKRYGGEEPRLDVFPTGKDGVLYPMNALSDEVFNEEKYMKLAPTADDVWFKAMGLLNKTPVRNIPGHKEFPIIKGSNSKTLFQVNRKTNDRMIRDVFAEYGLI